MIQDKRTAQRLNYSVPLKYYQRYSKRFDNSLTSNISDRGIGFIANDFLPVSTHLVFELRDPTTNEFIKAVGEVVWIANQPHAERFSVGAKFLNPPIPIG